MNGREFVEAVKLSVRDSAITSTIRQISDPSGRQVPRKQRIRADWFNSLDKADQDMVKSVIQEAVHQAVFGMLAVLDGVRPIEDAGEKGCLELWYIGKEKKLLNKKNKILLHDLYNVNDL